MSTLDDLRAAVVGMKKQDALDLTQKALNEGADPQEIINGYLITALTEVGDRFEKRKIFVPEMMLAAKTMQSCVEIIKPLIKSEAEKKLGTVVIGTVFGDLHDIGKNLVKLMMESSGLRVIDLGENVPVDKFVEGAREHGADVVGLSSLLTTGDPYVKQTVEALRASGLPVKVICGGAALTAKFVLETCGADAHAKDAADAVRKVKELLGL